MTAHADARKRIPFVVLAVVVLATAGWWAWTTWGPGGSSAPSGALTASGTIEAEEAQVSSVIAGRIASVTATEGATVKAGDVLFRLDSDILDLQIEQATEGYNAAVAALQQVKDDKGTKAEKAAASARVEQAKRAIEMAMVQRDYATIKAPVAGVLSAVAADPGETASPGKALATISDLDNLYVSVYVPETEIGNVALGDTATVTTDSSADDFSGRVTFIASEAEFTPSNIETKDQRVKLVYEVRVKLEGGRDVLKPGMPVDVVFD